MLSTLGGGFSCLGEADKESAATAGRIAQRQLLVSSATGDPNLVARCCIYQVYSYCQRGMRSHAIRLLRLTHGFLKRLLSEGRCEPVLVHMYQAAVHRIRHMRVLYGCIADSVSVSKVTSSRLRR